MARLARVVAPGVPHHVTQRGNRRQRTFFGDDDYTLYLALMAEHCARHGVAIWAWCLMPNHVHLIAVPARGEDLRAAIGEAHRRYARHVNLRENWRGYLWQGRFASCPMDEPHALMTARYIELNPLRAGLVATPQAWKWSSARAHLGRRADPLTAASPLLDLAGDWRMFLRTAPAAFRHVPADGDDRDPAVETLRAHQRTGRPLGDARFIDRLETTLGRTLRRRKPGPKPKATAAAVEPKTTRKAKPAAKPRPRAAAKTRAKPRRGRGGGRD